MSQYALPLLHPPLYTEENFIVSACNEGAWRWVSAWPQWPGHALFLCGAPGSGKSHLSHIWARKSGASIAAAAALEEPAPGSWLVEEVEAMRDPRPLLHLFNAVRENGGYLLMTGGVPPARLGIALPDLSSRLLATPLATIGEADDTVLAAAMRKQFADRQMKVGEEVIAYLLPRMERSLTQIQSLVAHIDEAAMREHKGVTVPFVRRLLETRQHPRL